MKFFNTIPGDGEVAILLYGDVGDGQKVDSGRVVSELMALQAQYDKIDVRINSNGGDVFSGIAIYNALRTSKADITIYVDGVAASIAGIIALCGKPLYMSPYAKLMLHAVSGGTWGNASALRQTASMMETLQGDLARMIAHRCGMEAKEVTARYFDEKDHWISADEAVSMKLADGLYDMGEKPETEPKTAGEVYQYFNNRLQTQPQNQNKDMALLEELKKMPTFKDVNSEAELLMNYIHDAKNYADNVMKYPGVPVNEACTQYLTDEYKELFKAFDIPESANFFTLSSLSSESLEMYDLFISNVMASSNS